MTSPCQLVLLRHGESEWNKLNLFTGWRDVKLTEQGEREHGVRPLARMAQLGMVGPRLIAVHAVHLTDGELDALARPERRRGRQSRARRFQLSFRLCRRLL